MFNEEKYFIQLLLTKRQMTESDAKNAYRELLSVKKRQEEDEGAESVDLEKEEFVNKIRDINAQLAVINMRIEKTLCEITNTTYYVIIPTCYQEDTLNQKPWEIKGMEFFKKIILHILETGSGTITDGLVEHFRNECLLSDTEFEAIIKRLVDEKYIMQLDDEIALTALCVAEFATFLKINFPDILKMCDLCKNITVKGIRCQSCETLVHELCLNKLFASLKSGCARKCPHCKELWVE